MIKWKVLAPSLEKFNKWYVSHHVAIKKMQGLSVDYIMHPDRIVGLGSPNCIVCLPGWENNPRYDVEMIKATFKLMGYDLDKGLQVDWVKAKVVSCEGRCTNV